MNEEPVHLSERVAKLLGEATVSELRLHETSLRLARPLRTARAEIASRDIIEVRAVVTARGAEVVGWGEAAPLAGWSTEELSDVRDDLVRVRDRIAVAGPSSGPATLARIRTSSARFAFSSAVLDAVSKAHNQPLRRLFDPTARNRVRLNATIGFGSVEEAREKASMAIGEGFGTLKVKVGGDLTTDLARVAAVRSLSDGIDIRLDANGAWTRGEATEALARFAQFSIEYVEQPVAADDLDGLARVRRDSEVDIAADESCFPSERAVRIVRNEIVDVVVIKPSLYGSWGEVAELIEAARAASVGVVFTSAIDGSISRAAVAQMAAAWIEGETACGLATGGWFERDVDRREDFVRDGRLFLGSGGGIGFCPAD